jgi:hypothetical protein
MPPPPPPNGEDIAFSKERGWRSGPPKYCQMVDGTFIGAGPGWRPKKAGKNATPLPKGDAPGAENSKGDEA